MAASNVRFTPYQRKDRSMGKKKTTPEEPSQSNFSQVPKLHEVEKIHKLPYRQLPVLMMNTSFPLNASCSKEAVVGLNPSDQTFKPEVQFVRRSSGSRVGVSLNQKEWEELLSNSDSINKYFEGGSTGLKTFQLGSFCAAFQTVYGKHTLVIYERTPVHHGAFSPDTIAIQQVTWKGIQTARNCITQALSDSAKISTNASSRFEELATIVLDHLREKLTDDTQDDYDTITTTTSNFLNGLNFHGFKPFDPNNSLICYNLTLFCVPLFVSHFKINTFYTNFNTEA